MHVVVCIKQVPNTTQVRIHPETNTLIREGVESIISPFDENALEAALLLKETSGARVTVLTMGPPQAEAVLREALARGADAAELICDRAFAGSDTWATSNALAAAVRRLEPKADLLLFGKQAIDGDTAQVGPGVAELLGWPVIPFIRKLEVRDGQVHVERAFEDGYERIECPLPVALTALKELNVPRMASLKGRMRARKAELPVRTAEALGVNPDLVGLKGSPTRVIRIFNPPPKTGGVVVDGQDPAAAAAAVLDTLRARKLI